MNESDAAGQTWAGEVLHTVRYEGYEPFWEKLVDWRGPQRGTRRKLADGLLNYVAQRQEMMAYDEFERQGWKIGSGPIEAMCKATTRRLKGPGPGAPGLGRRQRRSHDGPGINLSEQVVGPLLEKCSRSTKLASARIFGHTRSRVGFRTTVDSVPDFW